MMTPSQDRGDDLVVKRCGCGRSYLQREWRGLPRIGFQVGYRDEHEVPCELRNCACGSTLSVAVELEEAIEVATRGADRERASAARTAIEILQGGGEVARLRALLRRAVADLVEPVLISHISEGTTWRAEADAFVRECAPIVFGPEESVFGIRGARRKG